MLLSLSLMTGLVPTKSEIKIQLCYYRYWSFQHLSLSVIVWKTLRKLSHNSFTLIIHALPIPNIVSVSASKHCVLKAQYSSPQYTQLHLSIKIYIDYEVISIYLPYGVV